MDRPGGKSRNSRSEASSASGIFFLLSSLNLEEEKRVKKKGAKGSSVAEAVNDIDHEREITGGKNLPLQQILRSHFKSTQHFE